MDDLCLVPDVVIPSYFKVPDFVKYDGTSCPDNTFSKEDPTTRKGRKGMGGLFSIEFDKVYIAMVP